MSWFRSHRIILGLILFACFTAFGIIPALGDQLEDIKKQQQKVQQDMEQQKKILEQKEQEQKSVLSQLNDLELDLEETRKDLKSLEKQLANAEARVKETEQELVETEAILNDRTEVFKNRIREVYLNGQVTYLEVLFKATSVSDFLTRFDLLESLVELDVETLNIIETKKQEVTEKKAELERRRNEIADLKIRTERQRERIANRTEEKKVMLKDLNRQKAALERALNELEELSEKLAKEIRRIQELRKRQRAAASGKFHWPVPDYYGVTSDYGMRNHPILRSKRMHTGIDIGAPNGTPTVAALDGQVIYTGWLGAYGNVVVLDHGGGLSSMYAHLSGISVSENQEVKRGQEVGRVGSTGWSTGPHLHFEVRENGEPVSPWKYLSR